MNELEGNDRQMTIAEQMQLEENLYIGTKIIKAFPMTKVMYCDYRGWNVPEGEDPDEEVYLVEYEEDSNSKPNHNDHKGYISMSPKHVFDKAYRKAGTYMDRLIIERSDLNDKMVKLRGALDNKKVPEDQVEILIKQYDAMGQYLYILNTRLK